MRNVALIACSKSKRKGVWPARNLYTGNLFTFSVALAEARGMEVWILSAKHGLVDAKAVINDYDTELGRLGGTDRKAWAEKTARALRAEFGTDRVHFTVLASAAYEAAMVDAATTVASRWQIDYPLRGKDLVQRMKWLSTELKAERSTP